jgi:hypothetical protein
MLNFVYLRSSRLYFFVFLAWFMHCQQGGEVWAWSDLLHAFRRSPSGFELFLSSSSFPGGIGLTDGGHRSDLCSSQVMGDLAHLSDWWGWPVRAELLQLLYFLQVVCMHSTKGELHWFRWSLHVCRGSSLWFSRFWFGGLRSLLEHSLSWMCRAVALA